MSGSLRSSSSVSRSRGLDRERMDGAADLVAEDVVDQLVLLDTREAREPLRHHLRPEVVAAAGQVLHFHPCPGQSPLDALLQVVRGWHPASGYRRLRRYNEDPMVTLTDIAAEKVRDFMQGQSAEREVGLRVGVRGGGCSGFQYALALDEQREDDHVFDSSGIRVLVDPASLRYVEGSTVDFTEDRKSTRLNSSHA